MEIGCIFMSMCLQVNLHDRSHLLFCHHAKKLQSVFDFDLLKSFITRADFK